MQYIIMLFLSLYVLISHLWDGHLISCGFLIEADIWYSSDFIDMRAQKLDKNLAVERCHVMHQCILTSNKRVQKEILKTACFCCREGVGRLKNGMRSVFVRGGLSFLLSVLFPCTGNFSAVFSFLVDGA